MSNKEIARAFQLLGNLMELHDENPFKIRSYQNAYIALRKIDRPLAEMPDEEILAVKGLGKSILSGIRELQETGELQALQTLLGRTPAGVRELLEIKGLGPKKIRRLWKDLDIQTPGELLYACEENRLIEFKGFGYKTQEELRKKVQYYLDSKDLFLFQHAEQIANEVMALFSKQFEGNRFAMTGELRRCCPVVDTIALITDASAAQLSSAEIKELGLTDGGKPMIFTYKDAIEIQVHTSEPGAYVSDLFVNTGNADFVSAFPGDKIAGKMFSSEEEIFSAAGLPYIPPELRDIPDILDRAGDIPFGELITEADIKGVLHNHSTYSDGLNSLREMAEYVKALGYPYFGICDHSKSAFYANGLQPERVLQQFEEIDALNAELAPFRIYKGIESDILSDGSLDYAEDLLKQFDFIVASVHSNLRMDEDKATARLVRAVENPYTRILGHPTGRLLLAREGYPVNYRKLIDACAANDVVIELNANPMRLDIDYRQIPYALEKGVKIAINPDAHSMDGIHHIRFGVLTARKAGLTKSMCLNCLSRDAFEAWVQQ